MRTLRNLRYKRKRTYHIILSSTGHNSDFFLFEQTRSSPTLVNHSDITMFSFIPSDDLNFSYYLGPQIHVFIAR
jgi:hypothetical protein